MDIQPIAYFESPLKSKFGVPRQSGLVAELTGRIVFEKAFRQMEAVRGLDGFDYLWLIWEFSGVRRKESGVRSQETGVGSLTVRPPRLGGNKRMGVSPRGHPSVRIL